MLTGACLSRACGLPARARYATAACVIAAELPDIDYLYRLGGPLTYFQHHRGWTHAAWSLPLQALLVVGIFWVKHQTRTAWKRHRSVQEPAPTRWWALWVFALLALCSHLLLDWSNNYGVRPFAPFYPKWFAGELVFIVEPLILSVLALALVVPLLFSLVHREIGIRRPRYPGRGAALTALVLVGCLWGYRALQRGDAEAVMRGQELRGGRLLKLSISPYPVNPYRWHVVAETPLNFQTGTVDTREGIFETDAQQVIPKPAATLATLAAKRSWLGQAYLDWSQFPVVRDAGTAAEVHPERSLTEMEGAMRVVEFQDLRFGYDVLGLRGTSGSKTLGAEAWVDGDRQVRRIFVGTVEQPLSH